MSEVNTRHAAPGDKPPHAQGVARGIIVYALGFVIAGLLTAVSFYVTRSPLIWTPGIPMGLIVLAVAQMGVHLTFFLHINTSPDSTNTVLALSWGLLIVFLIIAGSLFIMSNLDHNMLPMNEVLRMQR